MTRQSDLWKMAVAASSQARGVAAREELSAWLDAERDATADEQAPADGERAEAPAYAVKRGRVVRVPDHEVRAVVARLRRPGGRVHTHGR